MAEAKRAWGEGEFTRANWTVTEVAVANMAAVENVQFCKRIIAMEYDDYVTAMEKD